MLAGHKDVTTTLRYYQAISEDDLRAGSLRFSRIIEG